MTMRVLGLCKSHGRPEYVERGVCSQACSIVRSFPCGPEFCVYCADIIRAPRQLFVTTVSPRGFPSLSKRGRGFCSRNTGIGAGDAHQGNLGVSVPYFCAHSRPRGREAFLELPESELRPWSGRGDCPGAVPLGSLSSRLITHPLSTMAPKMMLRAALWSSLCAPVSALPRWWLLLVVTVMSPTEGFSPSLSFLL